MTKTDTLAGLRILAERHGTEDKRKKAAARLAKLEAAAKAGDKR